MLGKKLKPHLPYASDNGTPQESLRQQVLNVVVSAFYSPNGNDCGGVELTLRNGTKLVKHPRDFMTGAIIEQATSNAIDCAAFAAAEMETDDFGLDANTIIDSLESVVAGMIENLSPRNAGDYLDLPDEADVATVRRLTRPGGRTHRLVQ